MMNALNSSETTRGLTHMLPYDYARCGGIGNETEGLLEDCQACLRRTSPGRPDGLQSHMKPPAALFCEYAIYPDNYKNHTFIEPEEVTVCQ